MLSSTNISPAHILIVEDEPKLASLVADYLAAAGYRSTVITEGQIVVDWTTQYHPDLVLLDVMLPGLDGYTVCRALRQISTVPIIMMTARVEEIDRLIGLDSGADDYICKPFSFPEMVARVKAILRRAARESGNPMLSSQSAWPLQLKPERFEAHLNNSLLVLTPVEFRLLAKLAESVGRVFSRDVLMNAAYVDHRIVNDRTIDSHVKNLRRKLMDAGADESVIRSIYGMGYKLDL